MKCHGCGVEKDPSVKEVYPYPSDGLTDDPMEPLITFDCSVSPGGGGWKMVIVCHECFHRLDPDMWICQSIWESINPVVPFDSLPSPYDGPYQHRYELSSYEAKTDPA